MNMGTPVGFCWPKSGVLLAWAGVPPPKLKIAELPSPLLAEGTVFPKLLPGVVAGSVVWEPPPKENSPLVPPVLAAGAAAGAPPPNWNIDELGAAGWPLAPLAPKLNDVVG